MTETQTADRPRTALAVTDTGAFANLLDTARFEHMWRIATMFARSGLVPKHFSGNPDACMVAVNLAIRLESDPFMVMQNMYIAPGNKPAWLGQFAIALINQRGGLSGKLQFEFSGEGDDYGCAAIGVDKVTGAALVGTRITVGTAKAEGWYSQNPKWRNPGTQQQMLTYRAGAWFGRAYCPGALLGMPTADEVEDVEGVVVAGTAEVYRPVAGVTGAPPRPTKHTDPSPVDTAEIDPNTGERHEPPAEDEAKPKSDIALEVADKSGDVVIDVAAGTVEVVKATVPIIPVHKVEGSRANDWDRYFDEMTQAANGIEPALIDTFALENAEFLLLMQKQARVLHSGLMARLNDRKAAKPQP